MKQLFTFMGLALSAPLFAVQPLGNFKGMSFSGVTSRHVTEFVGGTHSSCETHVNSIEVTKCDVQGGSLVVTGAPENALSMKFTQVTIVKTDNKELGYYYRGTTDLQIGDRVVNVPIRVTVSTEAATPDRILGIMELSDQYAKTSFEAYRIP